MNKEVPTTIFTPLKINESPSDYFVSTTIASSFIFGTENYFRVKNGELSKTVAFNKTAKMSLQAGIASASTVASLQYLVNKNYLKALLSASFGVASVVAIEKFSKAKKIVNNEEK